MAQDARVGSHCRQMRVCVCVCVDKMTRLIQSVQKNSTSKANCDTQRYALLYARVVHAVSVYNFCTV